MEIRQDSDQVLLIRGINGLDIGQWDRGSGFSHQWVTRQLSRKMFHRKL